MNNIGDRQMRGFVASILAAALIAGMAASASAAPPRAPAPRDPLQPVIQELDAVAWDLTFVMSEPVRHNDFRMVIEELNLLTWVMGRDERQLQAVLAEEPVPPSAQATADLQKILAAAQQIVQEAQDGLARHSNPPQNLVEAVDNVEAAAQAVTNAVNEFLGTGPQYD